MSDNWIADVVGRMHIAKITGQALAKESGYCSAYISEILNKRKCTEETKQKILDALCRLEAKQAELKEAAHD